MPQKLWALASLLASIGCAGEDISAPVPANSAPVKLNSGPALSPVEAAAVAVKAKAAKSHSSLPLPFAGPVGRSIGFASQSSLKGQYMQHKREFGGISIQNYLRKAQELRDRPLEQTTLEGVKPNGEIVRFDRLRKAMLVYRRDRVIRSYFKPRLGERTFFEQIR